MAHADAKGRGAACYTCLLACSNLRPGPPQSTIIEISDTSIKRCVADGQGATEGRPSFRRRRIRHGCLQHAAVVYLDQRTSGGHSVIRPLINSESTFDTIGLVLDVIAIVAVCQLR